MSTKDPKDKQGLSHSEMMDQQQIEKIVAALLPKVVDLQRKLIQELERSQSLKFEQLQLEIQSIKDDQRAIQDTQKTILDDQKVIQDTQKTILDDQRAIQDTQKTIQDAQRAIQDDQKEMESSIKKLETELEELYKKRGE